MPVPSFCLLCHSSTPSLANHDDVSTTHRRLYSCLKTRATALEAQPREPKLDLADAIPVDFDRAAGSDSNCVVAGVAIQRRGQIQDRSEFVQKDVAVALYPLNPRRRLRPVLPS